MSDIIFDFGDFQIQAMLNDSPTSKALLDILPIEGSAQIWGEEIYFSTDVDIKEDEWAKETVELGDIAFWPPGKAVCLFFGPTPISGSGEIRPASSTNIMGKLLGDLEILKSVNSGSLIKVYFK
jgi:hypothetical protein